MNKLFWTLPVAFAITACGTLSDAMGPDVISFSVSEPTPDAGCDEGVGYLDGDGDGFGRIEIPWSCEAPDGLVSVGGDCDDLDVEVYPGAPDSCHSGRDEDCSGLECDDVSLLSSPVIADSESVVGWYVRPAQRRLLALGQVDDGTVVLVGEAPTWELQPLTPPGFWAATHPVGEAACVVDQVGDLSVLSLEDGTHQLRATGASTCRSGQLVGTGGVDIVAFGDGIAQVLDLDGDFGTDPQGALVGLDGSATVSVLPDTDGDGFDEFVSQDTLTGVVHLLDGPFDGWRAVEDWDASLADENCLGGWFCEVGDLDGDGLEDVCVLSCSTDRFEFHGTPNEALSASGGFASLPYASRIFRAGDLDGDGFGDLLVEDVGQADRTFHFLYGPLEGAVEPSPNDQQLVDMPWYLYKLIADAGDLDGDGLADLVVFTSEQDDQNAEQINRWRLFFGAEI